MVTDTDRWKPVDLSDRRVAEGLADQLRTRTARLEAGERHAGWKIAWNDRLTQSRLSLGGCTFGFLTDRTRIDAPQRVPLDGVTLGAVEPELAIHLCADVPPEVSDEALAAAIDFVAPAIEVLDINGRFDDVADALRRNVFHRSYYISDSATRPEPGVLDGVTILATRNGKPASIPVRPAEVMGRPSEVVRFLAESLAQFRERLRAGDWILSGMLTPLPIWVRAGEDAEVDFGRLGKISMRFATMTEGR